MSEVTQLLREWSGGRQEARDELLGLVYEPLRAIAGRHLHREREGHTLQPTALVNELYLKLVGQRSVAWNDRAHFFAVAAQVMRRILVDHARAYQAAKRPRGEWRVAVDEHHAIASAPDCELMLLDQALTELTAFDPRQGRIVELRYFGGLSEQAVAEVLAVSRSTVTREWQTARAWLYRRITGTSPKRQQ